MRPEVRKWGKKSIKEGRTSSNHYFASHIAFSYRVVKFLGVDRDALKISFRILLRVAGDGNIAGTKVEVYVADRVRGIELIIC